MTYEKKNGEFACFKKVGKKGTPYYNGTLTLDGKEYWVSIFSKKSQKGENYVSGIVEPKQPKPEEPVEQESSWDDKPFNDEVPL